MFVSRIDGSRYVLMASPFLIQFIFDDCVSGLFSDYYNIFLEDQPQLVNAGFLPSTV